MNPNDRRHHEPSKSVFIMPCIQPQIALAEAHSMTATNSWIVLLATILTIFLGGCGSSQTTAQTTTQTTTHHYEFVFASGFIYVYDIDNSGALVKTLTVPTTAGVRGAVASAVTGRLYIAYGSDSGSDGSQLAYDLATDAVIWTKHHSHGIDSQAISPDGKKIFMPTGEVSSGSTWEVEDPATGNDIGSISVGGTGAGSGTGPH